MKKTVLVKSKYNILFDGNNMAFRSAAVIKLTNSAGRSVSVPFGVLRSIRSIISSFSTDTITVIWDGSRSKLRTDLLPEYKKSNRRKENKEKFEEDNIYDNIKITQELLSYLGVPQIKINATEADDVIADMADTVKVVLIVSTDKDFLQLINNNISMYNPFTNTIINNYNFTSEVLPPLTPDQYLEYHILLGDKSDNIDGVPGIGKKTAYQLISKFKTIDKAIKSIERSPNAYNKRELNLIVGEYRNQIQVNRKLIDLREFRMDNTVDYKMNTLDIAPMPNYRKFEIAIRDNQLKFKSIYDDISYWLFPFRKARVRQIVGKLR